MKFSCLTWNTAKRLKYVYDQVKLIQQTNPDIVALQEVIISSDKKFKRLLASHYPNIASSFDLAPDTSVLTKKRMFGQIIASKFPLQPEDPNKLDIPWQERVLTVKIQLDGEEITMHTTHIPPGSQNGSMKLECIGAFVGTGVGSYQTWMRSACSPSATIRAPGSSLLNLAIRLRTFATSVDSVSLTSSGSAKRLIGRIPRDQSSASASDSPSIVATRKRSPSAANET